MSLDFNAAKVHRNESNPELLSLHDASNLHFSDLFFVALPISANNSWGYILGEEPKVVDCVLHTLLRHGRSSHVFPHVLNCIWCSLPGMLDWAARRHWVAAGGRSFSSEKVLEFFLTLTIKLDGNGES